MSAPPIAPLKVSRKQLKRLVEEGVPRDEWPERLCCSHRTIQRAEVRYGFREPQNIRPFTQQELSQIKRMHDEGVPVNWIAETFGRDVSRLYKRLGARGNGGWPSVWAQIRRNEEMLALHREFAPKGKWASR